LIVIVSFEFKCDLLIEKCQVSVNCISMLTWSAVDRGFEPRSGQTEDYKIGICCFSAKHTAKTG